MNKSRFGNKRSCAVAGLYEKHVVLSGEKSLLPLEGRSLFAPLAQRAINDRPTFSIVGEADTTILHSPLSILH